MAAAIGGCSATEDSGVEGPVTVYVSLPLTGPFAPEGRDAADGARLALEQAGGRAGDLEVRGEFLDDARARIWDPAAVGENARRAAQDSSTAAYIGELSSQPTRASLPVTNEAGIPQVSPGAGAIDLTGPAEGYPDSPDRYRPSGDQTFARVVPSDEAIARGAAQRLADLGVTRVYVDAPSRDPWSRLMAERFEEEARAGGVEPASPREAAVQPGEARVHFVRERDFADGRAQAVVTFETGDRTYSLTAVQDPARLPPTGRRFAADFRERFGRESGPYAAYGYEAMAAVLASIEGHDEDADSFRAGVRSALLELERPESILGSYSITEDGDSTLCRVQIVRGEGGDPAGFCVRS